MAQNSFGTGQMSIAICDRCGLKYRYTKLRADGAKPALRVCPTCYDKNHPIKTFKPRADNFTLHYPRPDVLLQADYEVVKPSTPLLDLGVDNSSQLGVTPPDTNLAVQSGAPSRGPILVNVNDKDLAVLKTRNELIISAEGYEDNTDLNQYVPPSLLKNL